MNDEILKTEDSVIPDDGTFKKKKTWIKIGVGALVVLIAAVVLSRVLLVTGIINPYEKDYIDVTGKTAEDIAKGKGMDYDKFLKAYGLPEDMSRKTFERAVYYNIPLRIVVKQTESIESFAELKASMGWDDSITEDTTLGDALDKTTLSNYVGDEQLERFKSLYELSDEVTGETLYGEVRNLVDAKEKEFREAEKADISEENNQSE